jgi:hypothetical protein
VDQVSVPDRGSRKEIWALLVVLGCMVADCSAFVDMGGFYLQYNMARIVLSTLTINRMRRFSGATKLAPFLPDHYFP